MAFGRPLAEQGTVRESIALSRIEIDQARLYVLKTADLIDRFGAKGARTEISAIKVAAPKVALDVIDRAIQLHGGAGVSERHPAGELLRPRPHPADRRRPRRRAHPRVAKEELARERPYARLSDCTGSTGAPCRRTQSSTTVAGRPPRRLPRPVGARGVLHRPARPSSVRRGWHSINYRDPAAGFVCAIVPDERTPSSSSSTAARNCRTPTACSPARASRCACCVFATAADVDEDVVTRYLDLAVELGTALRAR